MRIFVEGSSMLKERSGVGQYAKRLFETYAQKYPGDKVVIIGFKFFTQGDPDKPIKARGNLNYRIIRWLPGRIYNLWFKLGIAPPMDLLFRAKPKDFFFFPNFVRFPLFYNRRSLLVIHDLSFIYYSQFSHPKDLPYKLKYVPKSIKKAAQIVTISESSKSQIMDHYKVPEEKISIVRPGVDTEFFTRKSAAEVKKIRAKYKLPEKYIFYTSTLEPRKNIVGLLEAYEKLSDKTRAEYALVLAGGKGWQDGKIVSYSSQLVKQGLPIIQTGYVPDDDLPALYSGSSLFVFPSVYEGFGIPILEAMACGVPVIAADNSSLPEAAGDAAILIKAEDTTALSKAMQKVLDDKSLQQELIKKGHQQIKQFSWEHSAEQLKEALEKT